MASLTKAHSEGKQGKVAKNKGTKEAQGCSVYACLSRSSPDLLGELASGFNGHGLISSLSEKILFSFIALSGLLGKSKKFNGRGKYLFHPTA